MLNINITGFKTCDEFDSTELSEYKYIVKYYCNTMDISSILIQSRVECD